MTLLKNREKLNHDKVFFVNNVSGNTSRKKVVADVLNTDNCNVANLIHPSVDMNYVSIGYGCILPQGTNLGGNTIICY